MKFFNKSALATCILTGAAAFAGVAQATPITPTVKLAFPASFSKLFPVGYVETTITYNNGSDTETANVAAGIFGGGVATDASAGFDANTLFENANNVLAYCIDIVNNLLIQSAGVYHVNDIGQGQVVDPNGIRRDFGRTLSFIGAANHVAGQRGLEFADKNWLNPSYDWMAAAIQVGIWEALYEKNDSLLSIVSTEGDGWFSATSLGADGDKFLSDTFVAMKDPTVGALDAGQVKWMQIDGWQDLIVDPVDVPAPAPLLLLTAGLGLLSLRRRVSAAV